MTARTAPTARVGNFHIWKTDGGFVLTALDGDVLGTFPTAKAANAKGLALTAAAYKARTSA